MTMVGHSLLGFSLGALAIPRGWARRPKLLAFGVFGLLAGGPDLPAPFWGHSQYLISHSLFVNLGLIAGVVALAAACPRQRAALGGWPLVWAGTAAWLSHLLLDSFYSHGKGVRIFWPRRSQDLRGRVRLLREPARALLALARAPALREDGAEDG